MCSEVRDDPGDDAREVGLAGRPDDPPAPRLPVVSHGQRGSERLASDSCELLPRRPPLDVMSSAPTRLRASSRPRRTAGMATRVAGRRTSIDGFILRPPPPRASDGAFGDRSRRGTSAPRRQIQEDGAPPPSGYRPAACTEYGARVQDAFGRMLLDALDAAGHEIVERDDGFLGVPTMDYLAPVRRWHSVERRALGLSTVACSTLDAERVAWRWSFRHAGATSSRSTRR